MVFSPFPLVLCHKSGGGRDETTRNSKPYNKLFCHLKRQSKRNGRRDKNRSLGVIQNLSHEEEQERTGDEEEDQSSLESSSFTP